MHEDKMRPNPDTLKRYQQLLHSVQSGIAAQMGYADLHNTQHTGTEPKHLRVGIDSTKCEFAALVELLIELGVIPDMETLTQKFNKYLQRDVEDHEKSLSEKHGTTIRLA